ncbi:MAG: hypothetical protein PUP92_19315 [Rhizonema sp. PD38]|nr:hypothetical protein [Rhizonema sp. PD38]
MIKINQHTPLSFLPSADLQVLSRTASGSVILTSLDEQIGIGEAIAKLIWVTLVPLP